MSSEPQHPTSRISEALRPAGPPPAPLVPSSAPSAPAKPATPAKAPAPTPPSVSSGPPGGGADRTESRATVPTDRPEPSTSRINDALQPAAPEKPAAPPAPPRRTAPATPEPIPTPAPAPSAPAPTRSTGRPLPPEQPAAGAERPTETTTRLRPIRDSRTAPAPRTTPAPPPPARPAQPPARPVPAPRTGAAPPAAYPYDTWALGAPTPAETTTRLRPVQGRRTGRVVGAAVCAVLAAGLVGGAAAGALLTDSGPNERDEPPGFTPARALWHDAPVDTLFPRTLPGPSAGPGGAPRTWTRIVVAPDTACSARNLPPKLYAALSAVGCDRVLRATYTDATSSQVVTVALAFTQADPATMKTLGARAADELPPALAGPGTVAAHFGAAQRASWWRHVPADLPVVVTTVSGFADGRTVAVPEPAARAMTPKRTSPVAQAGLGHEAKGVGEAVEQALRRTVAATVEEDKR
ncbi:hypothetical protein [Streptomyces laurentii]|uniref:hypothetical protein n=1 Tax=Streptomyces laurentii TaxID=39478 RepID=UPI003681B138